MIVNDKALYSIYKTMNNLEGLGHLRQSLTSGLKEGVDYIDSRKYLVKGVTSQFNAFEDELIHIQPIPVGTAEKFSYLLVQKEGVVYDRDRIESVFRNFTKSKALLFVKKSVTLNGVEHHLKDFELKISPSTFLVLDIETEPEMESLCAFMENHFAEIFKQQ